LSPSHGAVGRLLLCVLVLGCGPKKAPVAAMPVEPTTAPALAPTRLTAPEPLPERPFTIPAPSQGALANGVPVYVVENHEVPMVSVGLRFRIDGDSDPSRKEGLHDVAAEMMARGAGPYSAEAFDRRIRALGSQLGAGATDADLAIGSTSLKRNLGATLELMRLTVMEPRFDGDEWALLRKQTQDHVVARRESQTATANTVIERVLHGDRYLGRVVTEATIGNIGVNDLKVWQRKWVNSRNLAIYVGGDTTLTEILPLLEGAFGKIPAGPSTPGTLPPPVKASKPTITLVDRAGAAQAVITAASYVGSPADPDYYDLVVANRAWGGQFTARLNMNLREKNGYTYGARSGVDFSLVGARFDIATSVQSDKAVEAFKEILAELAAATSSRPFTDVEIADSRGSILASLPLQYEVPDTLISRLRDIRTYNLPADWVTGMPARVGRVTTASAQAAWNGHVGGAALRFVVVGDAASLRGPLAQLGYALDERDADGVPLAK
jgi:predicted Zn-dependent peptidase